MGARAHVPVLGRQVVDHLVADRGGTYVDCTFGGGGHSEAILARLCRDGRLLAIDWDGAAEPFARAVSDPRFSFVRANFADIADVLDGAGIGAVDGALLDLGLSSMQLADPGRGFSFSADGPLDMRMDPRRGGCAADVVNRMPEGDLGRLLSGLGDVPNARALARHLAGRRRRRPFAGTLELAEAVREVARRGGRLHPATRVFQALRVHVNGELDNLRRALGALAGRVRPGGRLAVICFQSGEDRVVKRHIGSPNSPGIPFVRACPLVRPTAEEVRANPRSRSARLRVGIRAGARP